jgi:REP element-mobilizing transposase RayT
LSREHVHMFVEIPPHIAVSDFVRRVKGRSSHRVQVTEIRHGVRTPGIRVFAGQRAETFYIDLGAVFDTLNLRRRLPTLTGLERTQTTLTRMV